MCAERLMMAGGGGESGRGMASGGKGEGGVVDGPFLPGPLARAEPGPRVYRRTVPAGTNFSAR